MARKNRKCAIIVVSLSTNREKGNARPSHKLAINAEGLGTSKEFVSPRTRLVIRETRIQPEIKIRRTLLQLFWVRSFLVHEESLGL